ncbi:MAG: hypothetical protein NTU74_01790 [Deltaproteobacteria bacterium]|nr:hypothetical protein [Deltaproteobacteria bacterium]
MRRAMIRCSQRRKVKCSGGDMGREANGHRQGRTKGIFFLPGGCLFTFEKAEVTDQRCRNLLPIDRVPMAERKRGILAVRAKGRQAEAGRDKNKFRPSGNIT